MTRAPLRASWPMDFAVPRLPPHHQQYQNRGTSSYKDFWLIVAFQGAKTRQKSDSPKPSSKRLVRDIRRATRKQYSAEEKIRIVLDGLRGEHSIAELCRREGIAESLYYSWSKEFLEAGIYAWLALAGVILLGSTLLWWATERAWGTTAGEPKATMKNEGYVYKPLKSLADDAVTSEPVSGGNSLVRGNFAGNLAKIGARASEFLPWFQALDGNFLPRLQGISCG
jgi:transposase